MAVVQISRIQIRRGQKNQGSGIPQLASGELAWAVDTQELFIGNGSVAEGAPYVGNSKILTENDNILDLFEQYQYKKNDPSIQTGDDSNYPVLRSIQERLDERVTVASFGAVGDQGSTDDTEAIQRAVNQLYLNPATFGLAEGRFVLEFGPGIYTISNTIYIPSYTSIVGAGQGRTVINYTGTGSAFEFINDTSTIGSPATLSSTTYSNQPKHISMSSFTLNLTTDNVTGFKLNAVRNSVFEDIGVSGSWATTDSVEANSIAVAMYAVSSIVTCEANQFNRIDISNLSYGFFAKQDIINNVIKSCNFYRLHMGVSFGVGANLSSVGEQYGPRNNSVTESVFIDINRQGIKVANGSGNLSNLNRFTNVGNDGGGNTAAVSGHIEFDSIGNSTVQDIFDRAEDLAPNTQTVTLTLNNPVTVTRNMTIFQSGSLASGTILVNATSATSIVVRTNGTFDTINNLTINGDTSPGDGNLTVRPIAVTVLQSNPYIGEVIGKTSFTNALTQEIGIVSVSSNIELFKLPMSNSIGYDVEYIYQSSTHARMRRGKLLLAVDRQNNNIQLVDEYEYTGTSGDDIKLKFSAAILDVDSDSSTDTIQIYYQNTASADIGTFSYTYRAIS